MNVKPENMMELIYGAPNYVVNDAIAWYSSSTFPDNVPDSVYRYITDTLQMTMEQVYAMIPGYIPGSGTGSGSGTGTGSTPSAPAEPEVDTRYHFSVSLGYRQELIDAELERKGLSYSDKLQPLEVAK